MLKKDCYLILFHKVHLHLWDILRSKVEQVNSPLMKTLYQLKETRMLQQKKLALIRSSLVPIRLLS